MRMLLLIGAGGFVGSILRYLLGGLAHQLSRRGDLPVGTVVVNILGCLAIGLLSTVDDRQLLSPEMRACLFVGLLGGFTTFSSFGLETANLWRQGTGTLALLHVATHLLLGLGAVWAGRALGQVMAS